MSGLPVQLTPLYMAYKHSYFDIVDFLISEGASWESLMTPLHLAVMLGERESMEQLMLQDNIAINATDCHLRTPLHLACRLGHNDIAVTLIQNGCDLEIQDSEGHTPLAVACHAGHPDIVDFLMSYGADVQGDGKHLPLEIACSRECTDVVMRLLRAPYALNDCNSGDALMSACRHCHVDIVQILLLKILENKIVIDKRTLSDALCAASICKSFRSVSTARDLVSFGADVNLRDSKGRMALHCAIMKGNIPLTKFLIDSGAKATAPLAPGFLGRKTALYVACDKQNIEMTRILIKAGANINVSSDGTRLGTALSVACHHGNFVIAKLLLESGAYVNPPLRPGSLHPLPPLMAIMDAWFLNMLERKRVDRSRYLSVFQLLQHYGCEFSVLNMNEVMRKLYKLDRDGCLFILHGACAKLRHIRDSLLTVILDRNDMDAIAILTDCGYIFDNGQMARVNNNRDKAVASKLTQCVRETVSNSISLLGLCRIAVREILSRRHLSVRAAVAGLPLPERVKDYLNMAIR